MKLEHKEVLDFDIDKIKEIYKSCGWSAYLKNDDKLLKAYERNLLLYGAYYEGEMIGFIRCLGDGEHIVLIQDLIIHPHFQNQGIGTKLFDYVLDKYKDVRSIIVITDLTDDKSNNFYKKRGLYKIADRHMVAYIK